MNDWRSQAACIGLDPNMFFPEEGDIRTFRAAQAVCAGCPVRVDCFAHAVATREEFGIWGGFGARHREDEAQKFGMPGRRSLDRTKAVEIAARMRLSGCTTSVIAAELGVERRSVGRYLADARKLGLLAA